MKSSAKLCKLFKLWALFHIGISIVKSILNKPGFFYNIFISPIDLFFLNEYSVISLMHLHLYEKQAIKGLIKPLTNFQRLSITTILSQLLVLFALMVGISIQEELWHPIVAQPVVHFNNIVHFLLFGVLNITCLVAIGEELFFRHIFEKLLYDITRRKILSTIITALLFTLIHRNIKYSLTYFTLGCFFSYLYQKSGHIFYPIMAHAINNLVVVSITYLELSGMVESTIKSLPIIVRSIIAIGSLSAAYSCIAYGYLGIDIDKNSKT